MISFSEFEQNLARLKARVEEAASKYGRKAEEIAILPVTKNHPFDAAAYAFKAGLKSVGENRVQEARGKIGLVDSSLKWELIGHLQSNKARLAAEIFSRIQTVDSLSLAQKLNSAAANLNKTLRVLLQVNSGKDPAKFGMEIEDAPKIMEAILPLENLKIEGLMAIAPLSENLDEASRAFANLRNLRDSLEIELGVHLPELSMGMSGDLERAIEEGSTMIRVGTFLFGERIYV